MPDTLMEWLLGKFPQLVAEYKKGLGYGDIFESQYLCYLECLVAVRGSDPAGMWDAWKARIRENSGAPEGTPILAMNRQYGDDRDGLIEELEAFRRRLTDAPLPHAVIHAAEVPAVLEPEPEPEPTAPVPAAVPKLGTGRPEKVPRGQRRKPAVPEPGVFDIFGE